MGSIEIEKFAHTVPKIVHSTIFKEIRVTVFKPPFFDSANRMLSSKSKLWLSNLAILTLSNAVERGRVLKIKVGLIFRNPSSMKS